MAGLRGEFGKKVPIIYFANNSASLLREVKKTKADVIGIDWRIDMADAAKQIGKRFTVQGNLDPLALFLPPDKIRERVADILRKAKPLRGHVFNLGHGVVPETPVEGVRAVVDAVHELSGK